MSGFDWIRKAADMGADADARNAFEQNAQTEAEIAQRTLDFAVKVASVFGTASGLEILDYLRSRTVDMPNAIDPQLSLEPPGINLNPAEWMFIREGQNTVVRHIDGLIRLARNASNQPATQPQGAPADGTEI